MQTKDDVVAGAAVTLGVCSAGDFFQGDEFAVFDITRYDHTYNAELDRENVMPPPLDTLRSEGESRFIELYRLLWRMFAFILITIHQKIYNQAFKTALSVMIIFWCAQTLISQLYMYRQSEQIHRGMTPSKFKSPLLDNLCSLGVVTHTIARARWALVGVILMFFMMILYVLL